MDMKTIINQLKLTPHPEGGWFKEVGHSSIKQLDEIAQAQRYQYTSIYFLLSHSSPSHFHQLKHDELWFFHDGAAVTIHCLMPDHSYQKIVLGSDLDAGQVLQATVRAGVIFGSEVSDHAEFGLVSCVVAPGFDYQDFKLFTKAELNAVYPQVTSVIDRLAYATLPD
ncbi:cupin domain-containing protein [Furfurilactobacillus curtus]|uniref:Cupin n=1 Tax=Furfurilactobacillus curtus TaxID=1746200 RepID=A0ABQ5JM16_9LACO